MGARSEAARRRSPSVGRSARDLQELMPSDREALRRLSYNPGHAVTDLRSPLLRHCHEDAAAPLEHRARGQRRQADFTTSRRVGRSADGCVSDCWRYSIGSAPSASASRAMRKNDEDSGREGARPETMRSGRDGVEEDMIRRGARVTPQDFAIGLRG